MTRLTPALLREHYMHLAAMPFYPDIERYMSSRPVLVAALCGPNAVAKVRDLLGPTDSTKAPKGTIRGDYGESKSINVLHASDSVETARLELTRFFPSAEIFA
jgi:nucleoside-diphosphate kinase